MSLHETTVGSRGRPSGGIDVQAAPFHSRARPVVEDVATQNDAVLHDTDVSAEVRPPRLLYRQVCPSQISGGVRESTATQNEADTHESSLMNASSRGIAFDSDSARSDLQCHADPFQ